MSGPVRCSKRIFDGSRVDFGGHMCRKKATIERDGKPWCKLHDPERVAAKRAEREARWNAEHDAQKQVEASALALAAALGVGRPEYSTLSGKGGYTGGIVLSAEEAQRVIGWLESLRRER